MNTPAIHQAIRLRKYPEEMAWLCFPNSEYPEGITDLLRLCSSDKQLNAFADKYNIESKTLHTTLLNFIEKAMLTDKNSDEKILGVNKFTSLEESKLHYQLLMRIYHPDINATAEAAHYTSMITNAYNRLKKQQRNADKHTSINVTEYRVPPKSYYQATQKAQSQISNTRSAIALVSTIIIFTLVAIMGHFYDPAKPELVTNINPENKDNNNLINNQTANQNKFKMAALDSSNTGTNTRTADINDTEIQVLLRDLETAYEKGNVALIKPILANAPEIKNQTDQQINDKLETLFEITSQRKMLLYSFEWNNISGQLQGKGKFLSRYHLAGEAKWLTREGTASITAKKINSRFNVTQLDLENQSIEQ